MNRDAKHTTAREKDMRMSQRLYLTDNVSWLYSQLALAQLGVTVGHRDSQLMSPLGLIGSLENKLTGPFEGDRKIVCPIAPQVLPPLSECFLWALRGDTSIGPSKCADFLSHQSGRRQADTIIYLQDNKVSTITKPMTATGFLIYLFEPDKHPAN